MTISRRTLLGLGTAAFGSVVVGCSRAVHTTRATPSKAATGAPTRTGPASSSATTAPTASSRVSTPTKGGPALEIEHGPRTRDEVALTFHGAGDPAIARQLLTIFAAHRAQVTVFAVGTWLAANPAIAGEIVQAGHELGNHTYSHLNIDSLDATAAGNEIVRCRDLLVAQVGSGGAHFRQSQAQHSTAVVRQLAGAAGYVRCLSYDIDSLDYTDPGQTAIRRNVASAQPGSIVSLHFGHPGTVLAMPHILADLAARGLRPVTATTLLRP